MSSLGDEGELGTEEGGRKDWVCVCVCKYTRPTEKKIARESVIKYIWVLWGHSCFYRTRGARHLRLSLAHVWEATGSPATWAWGLLQLPICLRSGFWQT